MLDIIKGTVTSVIDGDTFEIKVERIGTHNKFSYNTYERIRIAYLNAPELPSASGHRARSILARVILRKYVKCDIKARDHYGRLIANVFVAQRPFTR